MTSRPFDFPIYERLLHVSDSLAFKRLAADDPEVFLLSAQLKASELFDLRAIMESDLDWGLVCAVPPFPLCWLEWDGVGIRLQEWNSELTDTHPVLIQHIFDLANHLVGIGEKPDSVERLASAMLFRFDADKIPTHAITLTWGMTANGEIIGGEKGIHGFSELSQELNAPTTGMTIAEIEARFQSEGGVPDHTLANRLATFLTLCHCQNIRLEKTPPPRSFRRRMERIGVTECRLNVIKLTGSREHYLTGPNAPEPGDGVALHRVRGHFKRYTPERPLFGHFVGRVWCPDHLRGNPEHGTIQHQYEAVPSNPPAKG